MPQIIHRLMGILFEDAGQGEERRRRSGMSPAGRGLVLAAVIGASYLGGYQGARSMSPVIEKRLGTLEADFSQMKDFLLSRGMPKKVPVSADTTTTFYAPVPE